MQGAARLLRTLTAAESIVAAIAYVIVAALLIGDVLGREGPLSKGAWGSELVSSMIGSEFHTKGIFGATKMAVFAAIVAGFIGLSLATASNSHIRPAFMDFVFKGQAARGATRAGDGFAFAFFTAAGVFGVFFVLQSLEYKEKAAVLYWQLWPIQMVIPYAFFSTAIRHGVFALWPDLKPVAEETVA